MPVEVVIEDARWQDAGLVALAEQGSAAALRHLSLDPDAWEIALLGCDDARIAILNQEFRGKPEPTNVLSWPSADRAPSAPGGTPPPPDPGADPELGDIAIAYDTCLREAGEAGRPLADHTCHLIVHAVLHLLGYDHGTLEDAELMEGLETAILATLGIPDPY